MAEAVIRRSPRALPVYAFYSLVRMAVAYLLSLAFALSYGYIAAYNKRAEALMIAILDILQSIPVLSFLPGVMLAMVALVSHPPARPGTRFHRPHFHRTGLEHGLQLLLFPQVHPPRTCAKPPRIYGFSRWQRFFQLELPFSTIGLVWNSMVSVAQGWFTLMLCEMFVLQNRDFRLPGLGSYLKTAADNGDKQAMAWGLATLIAVIVLLDQLLWRPLIVWSDKFKFEQVESASPPRSPLLAMLFNSTILGAVRHRVITPLSERLVVYLAHHHANADTPRPATSRTSHVVEALAALAIAALAFYGVFKAGMLLSHLSGAEFSLTVHAAAATLLRVTISLLLALAWTIPAGVAIGFHPRLARYAQPLAQIAASVPATALFPILLIVIISMGGGMNTASIVLMLLGTQWYILFNVIAGALAIPSDLRDVSGIFRFDLRERWLTVILPGIFPYLITGLVTASGGAWNASIVAEYFRTNDHTYTTLGLGAQISLASDSGNTRLLLIATVVMAAMVVTINRLLWKPLFRLAESRFRLDA